MPAPPTDHLARSFLRNSRWAATTIARATWTYNDWARWLDGRHTKLVDADREDCEEYLEHRLTTVTPASVQVDWRMLKALYRWLYDEGEIDHNPMARIKAPRVHETPVRVLDGADYRKLLAVCDRRREDGRRDEAIMSLMWWSGLRRGEVCGLDYDDIATDLSTVTVGSTTHVTKTRKMRTVPIAGETAAALDRYLRKRGYEPGPLFLSQHGDTHADRRLRPNSVQQLLRRRAHQAGLGRSVGAHEFRRAWTIRARRAGVSDLAMMSIGGWKSPAMLGRYSRMRSEELADDEYRRLFDTSGHAARRRGRRVK